MAETLDRRCWFQLLALLAAPTAPAQQSVRQPAGPASPVTGDMLAAALATLGLDFSQEQRQLMLPRVNRALRSIETLRQQEVPLDTEPAFTFPPATPPVAAKPAFRPERFRVRRDWRRAEDLAFYPVTDLAALVRARRVSSLELTRLYLERLRALAPKLHFAITFTDALAEEQALQADRELRRGRWRGPLHGIPWGAKDLFATKGIRTSWGAEPFQDQTPDYDATVVERLAAAGAVLVAKLSLGALAMGGLWFGGMTRTPWNPAQSSSGSSAGSASATAAGCVGFSLGTETLGSIVSPSIRCGVTGLRPTFGRVSRHGAMALSWSMDKVGPICRSVEDCALVLQAICGPDGRDRSVVAAPLSWQPRQPLSQLRIGLVEASFNDLKDNEKPVYAQAIEDLRRAGAQLKPAPLAELPDPEALLLILNAESAAAFDDITRDNRVAQLKDQGPGAWPNSFRSARLIPAVEYLRAQRLRTILAQRFDRFFAGWDVLVSAPYGAQLLTITNLTGNPQVVVPCGFVDGMPRGLAFTARCWQEGDALRVAHAYQQATAWHKQRPPGLG